MPDEYTQKDIIIDTIAGFMPADPKYWEVLGLLSRRHEVLAFGSDSKIIGRVFEVLVTPVLQQAAEQLGFELGESEKQTVYPDFWFKKPNGRYIGIDVKTTLRRYRKKGGLSPFCFTLGAYSSFMRNGTKNIHGKYSDYDAHYVVGFLYSRCADATGGKTTLENTSAIIPAYRDVEYFIQEKHKVGGQTRGSGNTNNIATFKSNNIEDFVKGRGYFSDLGEAIFNDYWAHYPLYTDSKATKASLYTDLEGYFEWVERNAGEQLCDELKYIYGEWLAKTGIPHSIR